MPLPTATPYGLRDIKLTPYTDAAGTILAATSVDLPYARTLSFTDTEEFAELRGDDRLVTSVGQGAVVNWELESGGLSIDAYKVMAGGTVATSGNAETEKTTYSKTTGQSRPWFKIEGQSISDSGGDVHCIIYKARATGELSGSWGDGEFFLTAGSGIGIAPETGANANKLYDFVQNATAVAIV